jgi:hypothetical protein
MIAKKIITDSIFGKVIEYEHEANHINGINGAPFIDFSPTATFDFKMMDDEICLAMAKTTELKYPTVSGVTPPTLRAREFDATFENQAKFEYAGDRDSLKDMSIQGIRKYLFFKQLSVIPWFLILDLKPNLFNTKAQDLYPWNNVMDMMPYTKECIEKLPFKEIGRVVIYGSWPEARVPCHRDMPSTTNFDHHINFNPGGYRQVYIYDSVDDKKVYLPEEYLLYAYNTTDYHGVEPSTRFSYTVRVDGIYNDEAMELIHRDSPIKIDIN